MVSHGNLWVLIPLNQRLALIRLRETGAWCVSFSPFVRSLCIQLPQGLRGWGTLMAEELEIGSACQSFLQPVK